MTGSFLGLTYAEALRVAARSQLMPARVTVISPPSPGMGEGGLRVVSATEKDGRAEWILAYPQYHRFDSGTRKMKR